MNNIEVKISAQELINLEATLNSIKTTPSNCETDVTISQDEANTTPQPVFREEANLNDEEETHFENVG